jgi:S-adenosylmethionine synthetase
MKNYLFTSESVSCGHPDKLADQISDTILDAFLLKDKNSKVAVETFITDGLVVVGGEVHSNAYVDLKECARMVLKNAGYTSDFCFDPDNFGFISTLHEQSNDIRMGVEKENEIEQGAGDQGMMFGYATNETKQLMPLPFVLANLTMYIMDETKKKMKDVSVGYTMAPVLGPDAKCQYTVEYDGDTRRPVKVKTILISTQHKESLSESFIEQWIKDVIIPRVINYDTSWKSLFNDYELLVNPTGRFVIGGPKGDTGLTGRKIIVDTYGGSCPHGGGAFSGKDGSKVDRSGAYMARFLAKNIVAAELAKEATIQISYAIGKSYPLSVYVNTNGTGFYDDSILANAITKSIDLRPYAIIERFGLKNPVYAPTSVYGHFGNPVMENYGTIEYFKWEHIDHEFISKLIKNINENGFKN